MLLLVPVSMLLANVGVPIDSSIPVWAYECQKILSSIAGHCELLTHSKVHPNDQGGFVSAVHSLFGRISALLLKSHDRI